MKAVVRDNYGSTDALQFRDVARPEPGDRQVLIRVHAASVNPYDWHFLTGTPYIVRLIAGLRRPKSPQMGADVAGVVDEVGSEVHDVAVGDRVFGLADGSFGEAALASSESVAKIPDGIDFADAAALPMAGLTALQAVRDHANVQSGQSVLVIGASGGVGMYATQIAVARGATVSGVCSAHNIDLVRSFGAHDVIDYNSADFAAGGRTWDVVIDNVGNRSFGDLRRALTPDGVYVMISAPKTGSWIGPLRRTLLRRVRFAFASQRFANFIASASTADLTELAGMVESGLLRPVIDLRYPLADAASAIRAIESGHGRAKTVIDVIG